MDEQRQPLKLGLEWVESQIARDEMESWENAAFFIVETIDEDPDTGGKRTLRAFVDVGLALAYAEAREQELNGTLAEGEHGWRCRVLPVEGWGPLT